ncbi:MAG: transketolase [Deferrisomatales bacterium]|nr:transketolase [Deferrisomatales bacterium]
MPMQIAKGFREEELTPEQIRHLRTLSRAVRGDVLRMIRLADSGHPAGSLSSVDLYVTLLSAASLRSSQPEEPRRDRIVVGHAHSAPAFYGTLGRLDFFDLDDAIALFRKAGSIFEGNLERTVPGVEWTGGQLGLGLSAACGFALAARLNNLKYNVFVAMSDGEQLKGQVAEARRLAKRYRLNNITAIVDFNGGQGVSRGSELTPQHVKFEYIADGWDVIEISGHDHNEIYKALRRGIQIQSAPVLILAHTTAGSGVSFMENNPEYHERALTEEEYQEALRELRLEGDLSEAADYRAAFGEFDLEIAEEAATVPVPDVGEPASYPAGTVLETWKAFGEALRDVGGRNRGDGACPLAVVDTALPSAVGTEGFARENRDSYFPFGVQDQAAVTASGALSLEEVVTVFVGKGVFGLDGAYNQLRLNDLNRTHLKVVLTHLGLDGGEDGKALQCIDYLSLLDSLLGFRAVFPADANQADRVFRHLLGQAGNWVLGLGGEATPIVTDLEGQPFFGDGYEFRYGRLDLVRPGDHGVILVTGQMLAHALQAWGVLRERAMEPSVLHVSCPKSLDTSVDPVLLQCLRKGRVITYEDHNVHTGLGSRVANCIAARGISCRLLKMGVEHYGVSGSPGEVRRRMGLDPETLVAKALKFLKR